MEQYEKSYKCQLPETIPSLEDESVEALIQKAQEHMEIENLDEAVYAFLIARSMHGIYIEAVEAPGSNANKDWRVGIGGSLSKLQATLWGALRDAWTKFETPLDCIGMHPTQKKILAGLLGLGRRDSIESLFIHKRRADLQAKVDSLVVVDGGTSIKSFELLQAMRWIDVCLKLVLDNLKADLPFLLGKISGCEEPVASLVHPFDPSAIVSMVGRLYFPIVHQVRAVLFFLWC